MVTAAKIDPKSPVFAPRYSYAEADRLAGVTRGTAKRWLRGYHHRGPDGERRFHAPVIPGERLDDAEGYVSFADLVEVAALKRWRDLRWPPPTLRKVAEGCRRMFGLDRPLITERFKREAPAVFADRLACFVDLPPGQRKQAWETMRAFLDSLDYEDDFVSAWWPRGRDVPVAIDPDYGFGLPVVTRSGLRTLLRTEIVLEQFLAGETAAAIAEDYRLPLQSITAAIDFEASLSPEPA